MVRRTVTVSATGTVATDVASMPTISTVHTSDVGQDVFTIAYQG